MKNFIDWLVDKTNEDDVPFEMTRKDTIAWVKQIQDNLLSGGKNPWEGRHYGKCTNEDNVCAICIYQEWLSEYEKYCKEFFNT